MNENNSEVRSLIANITDSVLNFGDKFKAHNQQVLDVDAKVQEVESKIVEEKKQVTIEDFTFEDYQEAIVTKMADANRQMILGYNTSVEEGEASFEALKNMYRETFLPLEREKHLANFNALKENKGEDVDSFAKSVYSDLLLEQLKKQNQEEYEQRVMAHDEEVAYAMNELFDSKKAISDAVDKAISESSNINDEINSHVEYYHDLITAEEKRFNMRIKGKTDAEIEGYRKALQDSIRPYANMLMILESSRRLNELYLDTATDLQRFLSKEDYGNDAFIDESLARLDYLKEEIIRLKDINNSKEETIDSTISVANELVRKLNDYRSNKIHVNVVKNSDGTFSINIISKGIISSSYKFESENMIIRDGIITVAANGILENNLDNAIKGYITAMYKEISWDQARYNQVILERDQHIIVKYNDYTLADVKFAGLTDAVSKAIDASTKEPVQETYNQEEINELFHGSDNEIDTPVEEEIIEEEPIIEEEIIEEVPVENEIENDLIEEELPIIEEPVFEEEIIEEVPVVEEEVVEPLGDEIDEEVELTEEEQERANRNIALIERLGLNGGRVRVIAKRAIKNPAIKLIAGSALSIASFCTGYAPSLVDKICRPLLAIPPVSSMAVANAAATGGIAPLAGTLLGAGGVIVGTVGLIEAGYGLKYYTQKWANGRKMDNLAEDFGLKVKLNEESGELYFTKPTNIKTTDPEVATDEIIDRLNAVNQNIDFINPETGEIGYSRNDMFVLKETQPETFEEVINILEDLQENHGLKVEYDPEARMYNYKKEVRVTSENVNVLAEGLQDALDETYNNKYRRDNTLENPKREKNDLKEDNKYLKYCGMKEVTVDDLYGAFQNSELTIDEKQAVKSHYLHRSRISAIKEAIENKLRSVTGIFDRMNDWINNAEEIYAKEDELDMDEEETLDDNLKDETPVPEAESMEDMSSDEPKPEEEKTFSWDDDAIISPNIDEVPANVPETSIDTSSIDEIPVIEEVPEEPIINEEIPVIDEVLEPAVEEIPEVVETQEDVSIEEYTELENAMEELNVPSLEDASLEEMEKMAEAMSEATFEESLSNATSARTK